MLLILAAGAVYLIGNARVPLWDRDEPRNAEAARQMYQSGDWVVPHFLDQVRTAKPPFTYWMQASAMHVFGPNVFSARLPSVVAMVLTLIVLGNVLSAWDGPRRAFWTVLVLSTSAILIAWTARTSLTDSVLLLWVTIAQLCLYAMLRGYASWPIVIAMSIAIGCGILTKGPVILGVMATTIIVWLLFLIPRWRNRGGEAPAEPALAGRTTTVRQEPHPPLELASVRQEARPPLEAATVRQEPHPPLEAAVRQEAHPPFVALVKIAAAVLIVLAIALPWAILVEHRAPGFLLTSTSHDVARRIFEPLEQHKGPPGYYLLVVWGIFFPWSVLLPMTFVFAWKNRTDPRIRFALAAAIGPWLMMECVATKLPHYLVPIFPALAYLTADAIVRGLRGEHDDLLTRGMRATMALCGLIILALALLPWLLLKKFPALPVAPMVAFSIIGVIYALAVYIPFHRLRPARGLLAMGLGMMIAMAVAFGWLLPQMKFLALSKCLAGTLEQNGGGSDRTRPGDVQMIGYKEPSLAFYQGGTIREQSENDFLATHPPADWPEFTVIREDVWNRMPPTVQSQLKVIGSCRGLDLADKGRIWTVYVVRKKPN